MKKLLIPLITCFFFSILTFSLVQAVAEGDYCSRGPAVSNPYLEEYVMNENNYNENPVVIYTDICLDDNILSEGLCINNKIVLKNYTCPDGCLYRECLIKPEPEKKYSTARIKCYNGVVLDMNNGGFTDVSCKSPNEWLALANDVCKDQCTDSKCGAVNQSLSIYPHRECASASALMWGWGCKDDKQIDFYSFGRLNYTDRGEANSFPDSCYYVNFMIEPVCRNNTIINVVSKCPDGCKNDACIKPICGDDICESNGQTFSMSNDGSVGISSKIIDDLNIAFKRLGIDGTTKERVSAVLTINGQDYDVGGKYGSKIINNKEISAVILQDVYGADVSIKETSASCPEDCRAVSPLVSSNTQQNITQNKNLEVVQPSQQSGECIENEKKEYSCSDGTNILWCQCIGGKWNCVDNPSAQCKQNQGITSPCNGCVADGQCLSFGIRAENKYCSTNQTMADQKSSESACENSFECESNLCVSGKCINQTLFQKIIEWFKKLF